MKIPERARLVLVARVGEQSGGDVKAALGGGDVASVIICADGGEAAVFSSYCDELVPVIQGYLAAALICDHAQIAEHTKADGIFLEQQKPQLEHIIAGFSPDNIVGCGGFKNRHGALQVGEHKPDFVFFGKTTGDIRPQAHPKNLSLVRWWSEIIQLQSIVMGGNQLESVVECAQSGADFIALRRAVFEYSDGPAAAVEEANRLLDANAPHFDEAYFAH